MKEDVNYRAERETLLDKIEVAFAKHHLSIRAFRTLYIPLFGESSELTNSDLAKIIRIVLSIHGSFSYHNTFLSVIHQINYLS